MDSDSARKALAGHNVDSLAAALEFLGNQGKLTDLQLMLAFVKHIDQRVTKSAILACSNLIRNNLIDHFHGCPCGSPETRHGDGDAVPQIIDEIGKAYSPTKPAD